MILESPGHLRLLGRAGTVLYCAGVLTPEIVSCAGAYCFLATFCLLPFSCDISLVMACVLCMCRRSVCAGAGAGAGAGACAGAGAGEVAGAGVGKGAVYLMKWQFQHIGV